MRSYPKAKRIGLGVLVLLATSTAGALGYVGLQGEWMGMTIVRARVVCEDCSLDDIKKVYTPKHGKLMQFTHKNGQIVVEITWINEHSVWLYLLKPNTRVRAHPKVFQLLMAEENLFKEVQLSGVVRKSYIFDVAEVLVSPVDSPRSGTAFPPPAAGE